MNEIDTLNDLLNSDLSSVETSMPVLVADLYELKVIAGAVKTNDKKNSKYLEFQLATTAPANTTAGKTVPAGFKGVFHRISLLATEKYDPKQNLARFREAITGSKAGAFGDPQQYVGLTVLAQCKPSSDPAFGDSTEISRFVPRKG